MKKCPVNVDRAFLHLFCCQKELTGSERGFSLLELLPVNL